MALFGKTPETPTPDPTKEPDKTPAYVTKDDLVAAFDTMTSKLADAFAQSNARPVVVERTVTAAAPEPDITDEEIDGMIAEGGKGAASRVRSLIDRSLKRATDTVRGEIDAIRNYGTTMLGTLAERSAVASLDQERFTRYRKEISDLVNSCDPALRGHPDTWQTAYDTVIGRHAKELEHEAIEAHQRQQAEEERAAASASQPGARGAGRSQVVEDEMPTLHELAGDFPYIGDMTEADFIKKLNKGVAMDQRYKDWPDYMARRADVDKELRAIAEGTDVLGKTRVPPHMQ